MCSQRILDSEAAEGITTTLDRKTVTRLLQKLLRFDLVNVHFVSLPNASTQAKIYSHKSIARDSPEVKVVERDLQTKAEVMQQVEKNAGAQSTKAGVADAMTDGDLVLVRRA